MAAFLVAATAAGGALHFVVAVWLWWLPGPPASARSQGVNALWARHQWVGESHSSEDYARLARLLRSADISDVFFHVGPLDGDGSLPPDRYPHAADLLTALAARAPDVRAQAYVGQVTRRGGGPLDLADDSVRQRIAAASSALLEIGFGGIHYDIEPIYPGDEHFLDLLADTRALTQRHGAVLSAALEQVEVVPVGTVLRRVSDRYHDPTRRYLRAVAARVDQVAIMAYDTALPADWLFGAHVAWQTEQVVRAIGDEVTVFIGIPTYGRGHPLGYHAWAENVRSGVRGVRKGLARLPPADRRGVGIALFAEWTTSQDEWEWYRRAWLGPR